MARTMSQRKKRGERNEEEKYPTWQRELKKNDLSKEIRGKKRENEEKQNLRRVRQFSSTNNVTAEKRAKRNEVEKYERNDKKRK